MPLVQNKVLTSLYSDMNVFTDLCVIDIDIDIDIDRVDQTRRP